MPSIPNGTEERDVWEAKSGAWDRWEARLANEARMAEAYPALTVLYLEKEKAERFLREEL